MSTISKLSIRSLIGMMYVTGLVACIIALATDSNLAYVVGVTFAVIAAVVHLAEAMADERR